MRAVRFLVIAGLLLPGGALSAACGGPSEAGGARPTPTTATTSPAATGTSTPSVNPLASPSATPGDVNTRSRPCEAAVQFSINSGAPGRDYIRAEPRPPKNWGPGCEVLSAGDKCVVEWAGAYILTVGKDAYLTFQAWAKGQSKPFKEITAGPLPPEHSFRRAGFPVTIPSGVKEVSFRVVLLDTAKVPVAISDAYAYLIDCKPETS